MYEVTTETGRQYLIDQERGFFIRKGKNGSLDTDWIKIWQLKAGTHFNWPSQSPEGTWEDGFPEVGKFMYIAGKDVWWVSTEVVSIEELPSSEEEELD